MVRRNYCFPALGTDVFCGELLLARYVLLILAVIGCCIVAMVLGHTVENQHIMNNTM